MIMEENIEELQRYVPNVHFEQIPIKTLFQTKIIKGTYLCAMLKKRLQTSICIKSIL